MTPGSMAPDRAVPPALSIVLPMYNEADNLDRLFSRLLPVLARVGLSHEIICIDDGSRDDTFARLAGLCAHTPALRVLRFSRNFGKEAALSAGLDHARGDAVVLMDSDLQHPPELLESMVALWNGGAQMVYAQRLDRQTDGPLRRWLSRAFYRFYNAVSEVEMPAGAGDFRLLDRTVVEAVRALPERQRFMKGLMNWVGFRRASVPFQAEARAGGQSSFSLWRLFRLALDGLTAFTTLPLRIWSLIGLAVAIPAMVYGVALVVKTMVTGVDVPGYASLMVATVFLGGLQLFCLGVIGDYLGRVYTEVKGRPVYILSDRVGFEAAPQPAASPAPAGGSARTLDRVQ